jgi:uncharacterized membrane protein HdeD (DUF308 family)
MKKSNWLTFLINGLIAVLIGLLLLFVDPMAILKIADLIALVLVLSGVVLFLVGIRNIRKKQPYMLMMSEGLVAFIVGVILLIYTLESIKILVIFLGAWALVVGLIQVIISLRAKEKTRHNKVLQYNGILMGILGILMLLNPFGAVVLMKTIVGILALLVGLLLIYFSIVSATKRQAKS